VITRSGNQKNLTMPLGPRTGVDTLKKRELGIRPYIFFSTCTVVAILAKLPWLLKNFCS
jgi:hypothetical protein